MLEIFILIALTNKIGKKVSAKGHKSGKYKLITVGLWLGGEIMGIFIGNLLIRAGDFAIFLVYIIGLLGAAVGAAIANSIAKNLEPMPGYPIQENQQEIKQVIDPAEIERQRVEKLGVEVTVCPNCQTLNSLALMKCEKCNTNLEKIKPIHNPYI